MRPNNGEDKMISRALAAEFVGTDPGRPLDLGTDGPAQAGIAFANRFGGLLGA